MEVIGFLTINCYKMEEGVSNCDTPSWCILNVKDPLVEGFKVSN